MKGISRFVRRSCSVLVAGLLLGSGQVAAAGPPDQFCWVTLGTAGGPIVVAERSQPANLLLDGEKPILVDAGDGVSERLAALGLQPGAIDTLFLSHLHMDHIGGLQGLIGLRWMTAAKTPLVIYGPPGTQQLVDGIIASMQPTVQAGIGEGEHHSTDGIVKVVTIDGGQDFTLGDMRVRTVRNTHFVSDESAVNDKDAAVSLSFRFDRDDHGIGYTGDTGRSRAVTALFHGVDLVVSETIDLPRVLEMVRRNVGSSGNKARDLAAHLASHHLSPQQAGELARDASAQELVLTHLSIVGPTAAEEPTLLRGARSRFSGSVGVARDLSRFCLSGN